MLVWTETQKKNNVVHKFHDNISEASLSTSAVDNPIANKESREYVARQQFNGRFIFHYVELRIRAEGLPDRRRMLRQFLTGRRLEVGE